MLGFRRRTLAIGNEGVVLYGPAPRGGIEREVSIAWGVPNFEEQLIEALEKKNNRNSVTILFDSTDNAFRKEENIPKLNPMDRAKYVKRKLDQVFSSYPIRAFMEIKDKDVDRGKKGPAYLFYAITETENIDRVISCLFEAAVPIAGFGVLPIESEGMVAALASKLFGSKVKAKAKAKEGEEDKPKKRSKWAMMIGQNETGGLRQVIVKNGKMVLTRLTPTSEAGVQGKAWVDEVITEFKATETYLTRLGYRSDDGLDVIVIAGEKDDFYFSNKEFSPGNNFACLTADAALKQLGFKKNIIPDINYGDSLYGAWASKQKMLILSLRIPALMNILLPRLAARVVAVLLALAVLASAGYNYHIYDQYVGVVEQTEQKERQKRLLEKEYAKESEVFKAFPIALTKVKNTLAVTDGLDNKVFNLTPMLNILKKSLPVDIKLYQLKVEFTPNEKQTSRRRSSRSRSRTKSKGVGAKGGKIELEFQFALLKNIPLEEKVIRAEQIVEEIRRTFAGYEVDLTAQFGNVSRSGGFSGSNVEEEEQKKSMDTSDAIRSEDLATIRIVGAAP